MQLALRFRIGSTCFRLDESPSRSRNAMMPTSSAVAEIVNWDERGDAVLADLFGGLPLWVTNEIFRHT